jgi:hypothetical protein
MGRAGTKRATRQPLAMPVVRDAEAHEAVLMCPVASDSALTYPQPSRGVNRPLRIALRVVPRPYELSRGENRTQVWGEPVRLVVIPWGEPDKLLVKNNYSSNSSVG